MNTRLLRLLFIFYTSQEKHDTYFTSLGHLIFLSTNTIIYDMIEKEIINRNNLHQKLQVL